MVRYGPFLLLFSCYLLLSIGLSQPLSIGDDARYAQFAHNLSEGFYSPSDPAEINLWNGPGYPLVLLPFAAFDLPWILAKAANAFFLLGAILLLYKTLQLYIAPRQARITALVLGIYPPFLSSLHRLVTESFVLFLMGALVFFLCRHAHSKKAVSPFLLGAALILAWVMLTKIIFGYVIAALLVSSGLVLLFRRTAAIRDLVLVCALAMLLCAPYLAFTNGLTGKPFFWGNSGGLSLYWMSSPYPGEFGDWHNPRTLADSPELMANHGDFFVALAQLPPIAADDALRARAIRNILEHPGKYLLNIVANVGRMLFSYPYSYPVFTLST